MSTRERILDAVEAVVREQGFAQATTKAIAAHAGCSEGSIYNHFPSKQDLFGTMVSERMYGFPGFVASLEDRVGTETVAANLEELATRALGFYTKLLPMFGMLLGQGDPSGWRKDMPADRGPGSAARKVRDYLQAEQELGRVGPDADLEGIVQGLLGGCLAYAMVERIGGPDQLLVADPDDLVTHLVNAASAAVHA